MTDNALLQSTKGKDAENQTRGVYFDFGSTTPVDPRVLDAMMPLYTEMYGNPHSVSHEYGWTAEDLVEEARADVARLIGANPKEIIFTSGATESNNIALKGVASFYKDKKDHIITVKTEHKCVLESARALEDEGFRVTYLNVKDNGLIDLNELEEAISDKTAIVSVMMVNNEIGVIQPIKEIGEICRRHGALFHTDAAQACGKIPIDVNDMNIDLMSISGHKVYGPKGVGALFVRRRQPRVRLHPIVHGGRQERNMRSGTLPAPLCVGLGAACKVAMREMDRDYEHVKRLHKKLVDGLTSKLEHIQINGDIENRYPGNLNVSFAFVEGESLLMALRGIALSTGSACASASLEPSYVLKALGVSEDMAHTSLRFGIGRFTTDAEVDYVVERTVDAVMRLREMSPLWEMHMEGIDIGSVEWTHH